MLFPTIIRLHCANCGSKNEENRIQLLSDAIWNDVFHMLHYKFTCYHCQALNEGFIKTQEYLTREEKDNGGGEKRK